MKSKNDISLTIELQQKEIEQINPDKQRSQGK